MTDYERFLEYGRLRRISKHIDPYSIVFEKNKHLYIALSSGQIVDGNNLHERSNKAVYSWLTTLFYIGMDKKEREALNKAFKGGETHAKVF